MKKQMIKVNAALSLLLLGLFLGSCEKDELMKFEESSQYVVFPGLGDSGKYPGYNSTLREYTVDFSFLSVEMGTPSAIVKLPVRIMGFPVDYDREVGIKVVDDTVTTATSSQYRIIKASIPANETYGAIEIEIDNADELSEEKRVLRIELTNSKDLGVGSLEYIRGRLTWHNQLSPPATTNHYRSYNMLIASSLAFSSTSANAYSTAAHRLILSALGWEILPAYTAAPEYVYQNRGGYRAKVNQYIEDWNAAHPGQPLVHDGGTLQGQLIQARMTD